MFGETTWRELISQPDAWAELLARLDAGRGVPDVSLDACDEVVVVGSGTSYYLALAVADWIAGRSDRRVRAVPSCEVLLDPRETRAAPGRRLVVGVSRSGESSELVMAVEALKRTGATVLGVSCVEGSSLLKLADHGFLVSEGREDGLVMLRSFTGMLIALQHLFGTDADRAALRRLPAAGREVLDDRCAALKALANGRPFDRFVFLASGRSYPLAHEAGLKVQEMSCSTSETYHTLEYRHGPKATADGNTLITLFAPTDPGLGLALARDVKALGATLLVVGPGAEAYRDVADLAVPAAEGLDEAQACAVTLMPLQVVAYETAARRGKDPDAPANLSRVVLFAPAHA